STRGRSCAGVCRSGPRVACSVLRSDGVPAEKQGIAQAAQRDLGGDARARRQGEARSARASGGGAGGEGASRTSDPAGGKEPRAARGRLVARAPLRSFIRALLTGKRAVQPAQGRPV